MRNAEHSHPAGAGAVGTLRLTRRGRIVVWTAGMLAALGVLAGLASFGAAHAEASDVSGNVEFGYVIVQPGDTLWAVASRLDPSADPRDTIAEITRLNQLSDSDVIAGEPIAVPLRFSGAPEVLSEAALGSEAR